MKNLTIVENYLKLNKNSKYYLLLLFLVVEEPHSDKKDDAISEISADSVSEKNDPPIAPPVEPKVN